MKVMIWFESDSLGTMQLLEVEAPHVSSGLFDGGRALIVQYNDRLRVTRTDQLRKAHWITTIYDDGTVIESSTTPKKVVE